MKSSPRNLLKTFNQQSKASSVNMGNTQGSQARGRAVSDEEKMCFIYEEVERFKRYNPSEDEALFDEKSVGLIKRLMKSEELLACLESDELSFARRFIRRSCKNTLINTNTRRKGKGNVSLDGLLELGVDPSAFIAQGIHQEELMLQGTGMPSCPRALILWLEEPERVRRESNLPDGLTELLLSFPIFERRVLALAHATTLSTAQAAELLSELHGEVTYNMVNNTRARKVDPIVKRWVERQGAPTVA